MNTNRHLLRLSAREQSVLPDLLAWMPREVVDVHAHAGLRTHVREAHARIMRMSKSTFLYCDERMHRRLDANYGLHVVRRVVFAFPFVGIDVRAANAYILEWSQRDATVVPFLAGLSNAAEDEAYTIAELERGCYRGLKMYYDQGPLQARSVWQFYTRPILRVADAMGLPIILHLPSNNLPEDMDELEDVSARLPRLTIIVAHMGGIHTSPEGFESCCDGLGRLANVYFDTSCCTDAGVFRAALTRLGPERVLYASDQPYNALRMASYWHPTKGRSLMADRPYSWVDPEDWASSKTQRRTLICLHVQSLLALRAAVADLSDGFATEKIFRQNAVELLGLPVS